MDTYTDKDLDDNIAKKKFEKYKPMPCLLLRRCLVCGEISEEAHKDFESTRHMDHSSYTHQCDIVWDTMPSGTVFGHTELIGYVLDNATIEV